MEMLKKNQTEILESKKIKIKTSAENITNKKDLVEEQIQKGGGVRTNSDVYSRIKRVCDEHDQPSQVL